MKAVQVKEFGGPEVLQVVDLPIPTPAAGQVRMHRKDIKTTHQILLLLFLL
jgi:NADPH:quinone reductase-like Zn-dependent oxidoreductase